jgi:hypothetical protein
VASTGIGNAVSVSVEITFDMFSESELGEGLQGAKVLVWKVPAVVGVAVGFGQLAEQALLCLTQAAHQRRMP